jgi:hypothetical protein
MKRGGKAKRVAKTDSDEGKGEENESNIVSGDVDSGLDSVSASHLSASSLRINSTNSLLNLLSKCN